MCRVVGNSRGRVREIIVLIGEVERLRGYDSSSIIRKR